MIDDHLVCISILVFSRKLNYSAIQYVGQTHASQKVYLLKTIFE